MYYKITISLTLLLLLACTKEPEKNVLNPEWYWGEAMALKNGECWVADPYANEPTSINLFGISIFMTIFNNQGFERQELSFSRIPKVVGEYPLFDVSLFEMSDTAAAFFYTLEDDGHGILDSYMLYGGIPNTLSITAYDSLSRQISGTFDLTFIIDSIRGKKDPAAADTIRFEKGTFCTRIVE